MAVTVSKKALSAKKLLEMHQAGGGGGGGPFLNM
jgi:hypothetical protein